MELKRMHVFECVQCGRVNERACEKPVDKPNEVHHYHHDDTNKAPLSVEISRNAKGEYSYSIKAYGATIEEAYVACKDGVVLVEGRLQHE